MADPGFNIISTLLYDPESCFAGIEAATFPNVRHVYMLRYHRDRMLAAATEFGWQGAVDYLKGDEGLLRVKTEVNEQLKAICDHAQKVRFTL